MDYKFRNKNGITLIALVVTIIVLLILSGITIWTLTGKNGLLNNVAKAKFYTEMSALEERKALEKNITVIAEYTGYGEKGDFLGQRLSKEEIKKFENTLKAEIIFVRNNLGNGEQINTKRIWKNNIYECQDIWKDEDLLQGLTNDLYYITENSSGKKQAYIYDQVTDMCFKIKSTKIGSEIVHSLLYGKFILDGINSNGIGIAEDESKTFTSSDGTLSYEPDLNNLSYKTEIVYYSPTFEEYTVGIKEFIEDGKKKDLTVDGKKYVFANYVTEGTKIWANIKCSANGLTSYWVWIPRYAYKLTQDSSDKRQGTSSIIYIDINDKPLDTTKYGENLPEGYVVHSAFHQKEGLKGIWFSKYEPSPLETIKVDQTEPGEPDLANFNENDTKLIYYTQDGNSSIEVDYTLNPEQKITQEGKDYYFYNYSNKIWANVKCKANGLESWWVWIPRYAYKLENGQSNCILIDKNDKPIDTAKYGNTLPEAFTVHPAFKQGDGLEGIWFSKYEPSHEETLPVDSTEPKTPNLTNFSAADTKLIYYTLDGKSSTEVNYTLNPEQKITQDGKDYYFYNYTNKIWANVKCTANELESWWVWIPRYAYKVESGDAKIIFVDKENKPLDTAKYGESLPEGYQLHSAFAQGDGLEGIWFSKYEPSQE